jgi:hypothetical protein
MKKAELNEPVGGFEYSDWDWGETSNKKLREIFSVPEGKQLQSSENLDFFIEHLLNEIDVCELVSNFLYYAPTERIKEFAKDYVNFDEETQA